MTQGERVIKYLQEHGTITPMEAFEELQITKLATRVSELRREGVKIRKEDVVRVNKFGKRVRYKKYSLEEVEDEQNNRF